MATIRRTMRSDGICALTFDRDGSSANIFDRGTLDELRGQLDFIENSPQLRGVIFASAKPSIFIAGLDLKTIGENTPSGEIREIIEYGQTLFNRIASLKIPTVTAIHGAALGGGFELSLACDWRIASPDAATKIGLPETKLGLLPAWGGSTRLPRLIGLPKALDIILRRNTVPARVALKLGMVDDIVPAEILVDFAAKKIREGKPRRSNHWLVNNPLAAILISKKLRPQLLKKTRGHYPAVLKALEVATRGVSKPLPGSLALERNGILELVQGDACLNLIRLFFLRERAKKLPPVPPEAELIARTAVIGAGLMGAGIAQWLTAKKLPVLLRDINADQIAQGIKRIAALYRDGVMRHAFTRREARDGLDRIFPAPD
ncbi:MAG TPA: enoyl-CoA hydratase-related protein, partial [Verrucomicrobiae bacterium]|nr:enoyl-CoA hydratase-related protein [Verrucomicrobiae bacterium]